MSFVIGLLTVILVLDCLLLVLLILIQLPKKEAGVGVAFGGAATDALFGAGSGNVLTKATKYMAGSFFVLTLVLSVLQSHLYHRNAALFRKELEEQKQQALPPSVPAPNASVPVPPTAAPGASNGILLLKPEMAPTNAPAPAPPK